MGGLAARRPMEKRQPREHLRWERKTVGNSGAFCEYILRSDPSMAVNDQRPSGFEKTWSVGHPRLLLLVDQRRAHLRLHIDHERALVQEEGVHRALARRAVQQQRDAALRGGGAD